MPFIGTGHIWMMLILLAIIALPTWAFVRAVRPRPSVLPRYEPQQPPVYPPPPPPPPPAG
jgi:hypothetical protein